MYDILCVRRGERRGGKGDLRRGNHSSSRKDAESAEAHVVTPRHPPPAPSPLVPNGPDSYRTRVAWTGEEQAGEEGWSGKAAQEAVEKKKRGMIEVRTSCCPAFRRGKAEGDDRVAKSLLSSLSQGHLSIGGRE